ncbi:MAG: fasciclin domain-containing protein [Acidobacteria bacterium]|nr:fasciclin domain-containing protein [Acidobacteriota bacterium]MDA1237104.1 fasciclin domain-containing protein [Acidobacteriota bacterium]
MRPLKSITTALALGAALLFAGSAPAIAADKDIVDVAVEAGSFTTLVKAVQAAGLVDALKGEGPLTVFAPTDEAFAKVPAATLAALLKPENQEQLKAVLLYHVVSGKVMAADVVKLSEAATLNGESLKIMVESGHVSVNNAHVAKTDIAASNGVIHVIDAVMLPKNLGKLSD